MQTPMRRLPSPEQRQHGGGVDAVGTIEQRRGRKNVIADENTGARRMLIAAIRQESEFGGHVSLPGCGALR
jgi:hypothetical protein